VLTAAFVICQFISFVLGFALQSLRVTFGVFGLATLVVTLVSLYPLLSVLGSNWPSRVHHRSWYLHGQCSTSIPWSGFPYSMLMTRRRANDVKKIGSNVTCMSGSVDGWADLGCCRYVHRSHRFPFKFNADDCCWSGIYFILTAHHIIEPTHRCSLCVHWSQASMPTIK